MPPRARFVADFVIRDYGLMSEPAVHQKKVRRRSAKEVLCVSPNGLLFLAATNLAAGDLLESDRPVSLQDIQVTATGTERLSYDVAQAVTTVDRAVIDRESPQIIPEVLRGGIGTFFQQTTPGQGSVIIRGLKGSRILHLVDGMRLNNAFFRSAPNQYLTLVDPYAVARTEVIRGTAATLYGADAMGGVIQLLTPESHFDSSDWSIDGSAYAAYEHADRGRIFRAENAARNGTIRVMS